MRLKTPLILILMACLAVAIQSDSSAESDSVPRAKAGGVDLLLPCPEGEFAEVGDQLRTQLFELMTPSTNRLLTAYVSSKTKLELLGGSAAGGLGVYAMVQVPRRAEYVDITAQAFDEVAGKNAVSERTVAEKSQSAVDEINIRLKELGGKPVAIDHPEMLGTLFRKTNAVGLAMLMGVKDGGSDASVKMATVIGLIRVKQRLVFAYVYRPYESPETMDYLRKLLDTWTEQILAANK